MLDVGMQIETLWCWFGEERALDMLAEAGFQCCDFSMDAPWLAVNPLCAQTDAELTARYGALRRYARDRSVSFSQAHAPIRHWIAEEDPRYDAFVDMQRKSILVCAALGAPYLVIHPLLPPQAVGDAYRDEGWEINRRFYSRLMPDLKRYGVTLAVENLFTHAPGSVAARPTLACRAEDMCQWIDALNALAGETRFAACLDTGHALLTGGDPARMARTLGKRLGVLHIQDNDGATDQHSAPGLGKANWPQIAGALREIGYRGCLSYEAEGFVETFGRDCARQSLGLLYAIARNNLDWTNTTWRGAHT